MESKNKVVIFSNRVIIVGVSRNAFTSGMYFSNKLMAKSHKIIVNHKN